MPLASHLFIVQAAVPEDIEPAWNRWYDEVHLPEIARCPGFLSAQRYVADELSGRRYIAVYELESPAAMKSAELAARRGWGEFQGRVEYRSTVYSKRTGDAASGG